MAVIDDRFARQYFPNRNPLGEHIHLAGLDDLFEIVGVVDHVNQRGLDENERSALVQLYNSVDPIPDQFIPAMAKSAGFVVRTEVSNNGITSAIRQTVGKMDDQQVAYDFESMNQVETPESRALAALLAFRYVWGVVEPSSLAGTTIRQ